MSHLLDMTQAKRFVAQGKPEAALKLLRKKFKDLEHSQDPELLTFTGVVHLALHDAEQASAWFARATAVDAKYAAAWQGMGEAFAMAGHFGPAANAMYHALACASGNDSAMILQAAAYLRLAGQLDASSSLLSTHGPFVSDVSESIRLGNLSECLLEQGRLGAIAALEQEFESSLEVSRHFHSNLVRAALYRPEETAESLRGRAERWGRCFAPDPAAKCQPFRPRGPVARIRIGFLNTCCHAHNTAQHLLGILPHFDRKQWQVTLIHAGRKSDSITAALKGLADGWLQIDPDAPGTLAKIRDAKLDVLIEMNEFANGGLLWTLAGQPAPVMLHWYGNAITTGLGYLDGRFSDAYAEPPEVASTGSCEPVIPLAGGYYAYHPLPFHQKASLDAPFEKNGCVTLGVIHHLAKFSTPYLDCLREILRECPEARMQIWRSALADPATRRRFLSWLEQHKLPMERVSMHHDHEEIATLRCFAGFDLVPDAFPFSGDATSLDALASATPYVTLEGDHLCARRGAAILHHLSLDELIAKTPDDYVSRCVSLIQRPHALRELRARIHTDFPKSSLCDGKRLAREMMAKIRPLVDAKITV